MVIASWAQALAQPASEFGPIALTPLTGVVPEGLRGSLYANGPGRLGRGGIAVGHWFDGDGAILGVHFLPTGVTVSYRYVQTAGYRAEEKAGRLLYGGYGMVAPGPYWERFRYTLKNPANTSVLALEDRVLALWEAGNPHALDPITLETLGEEPMPAPYSAHPKRDPQTGDIVNFGLTPSGHLHLYRSNPKGQIQQHHQLFLGLGFPLLHDFVFAGRYLVFCIPPVRLDILPVVLRFKSFSESLQWQPQRGTQILVVDRETLQLVSRTVTDPWFQWHCGNGYTDAEGRIVFTVARYPDWHTNSFLQEVATGTTTTRTQATLWEITLDAHSGKVLENRELTPQSCDFPLVNPQQVGQKNRFTYYLAHRPGTSATGELFNTLGCFDHQREEGMITSVPNECYPTEPLYCPDSLEPAEGWLMTVVYCAQQQQSELWIYRAADLTASPVCKFALPGVIPMGFHGTWRGTS